MTFLRRYYAYHVTDIKEKERPAQALLTANQHELSGRSRIRCRISNVELLYFPLKDIGLNNLVSRIRLHDHGFGQVINLSESLVSHQEHGDDNPFL